MAALLSVDSTTDAAASLGLSELHCAALRGSAAEIRKLLAAGADAGARDEWGMTALMWGVCSGDEATVGALLESPDAPGVDAISKDGQTALLMAAVEGHASVVGRLLSAGADPSLRSTTGRTAPMIAAEARRVDIMTDLLSSGRCGDLEATDDEGMTALSRAACNASFSPRAEGCAAEDAVSVLLDWGADPRSPAAFLASSIVCFYEIASPAVAGLLRSRQVWIRRRRLVLWRRGLAPL